MNGKRRFSLKLKGINENKQQENYYTGFDKNLTSKFKLPLNLTGKIKDREQLTPARESDFKFKKKNSLMNELLLLRKQVNQLTEERDLAEKMSKQINTDRNQNLDKNLEQVLLLTKNRVKQLKAQLLRSKQMEDQLQKRCRELTEDYVFLKQIIGYGADNNKPFVSSREKIDRMITEVNIQYHKKPKNFTLLAREGFIKEKVDKNIIDVPIQSQLTNFDQEKKKKRTKVLFQMGSLVSSEKAPFANVDKEENSKTSSDKQDPDMNFRQTLKSIRTINNGQLTENIKSIMADNIDERIWHNKNSYKIKNSVRNTKPVKEKTSFMANLMSSSQNNDISFIKKDKEDDEEIKLNIQKNCNKNLIQKESTEQIINKNCICKIGDIDDGLNLQNSRYEISVEEYMETSSTTWQIESFVNKGSLCGFSIKNNKEGKYLESKLHGKVENNHNIMVIAGDEDIIEIYGLSYYRKVKYLKLVTSTNRVLILGEEGLDPEANIIKHNIPQKAILSKLCTIYDTVNECFVQIILEFL